MALKAPLMLLLLPLHQSMCACAECPHLFQIDGGDKDPGVFPVSHLPGCLPCDGQGGQGAVLSVSESGDKGPFFLLLGPARLRPDPEPIPSHGVGGPRAYSRAPLPFEGDFRSWVVAPIGEGTVTWAQVRWDRGKELVRAKRRTDLFQDVSGTWARRVPCSAVPCVLVGKQPTQPCSCSSLPRFAVFKK